MPSIRAMRYFQAVAETGSFSRAAERLKVAQPSITTQIQALENELGVELLVRHARGATLTKAGEFFKDQSAGILRQVDALSSDTRARADHPAGTLAIGTTSSLRSIVVAPVMRRFCDEYPNVRVRVIDQSPVTLREQVTTGEADAAIMPTIEPIKGLEATPLLSDPFCLIGPAGAGLRMDAPIRVQDLAGRPLMIAAHPNSFRRMLDRLAARANVDLDVRIEVDTLPLSIELLGAGGCYTLATGTVARRAIADGLACAAPLKGVVIEWVVATAHDRPRSAATLRFIEMLAEQCRALAPVEVPA